eukprot:COSAG01_NODE_18979_length_1039_cov_2.131915_1_plen_99_part_10
MPTHLGRTQLPNGAANPLLGSRQHRRGCFDHSGRRLPSRADWHVELQLVVQYQQGIGPRHHLLVHANAIQVLFEYQSDIFIVAAIVTTHCSNKRLAHLT